MCCGVLGVDLVNGELEVFGEFWYVGGWSSVDVYDRVGGCGLGGGVVEFEEDGVGVGDFDVEDCYIQVAFGVDGDACSVLCGVAVDGVEGVFGANSIFEVVIWQCNDIWRVAVGEQLEVL